jgi:hypothetical protein
LPVSQPGELIAMKFHAGVKIICQLGTPNTLQEHPGSWCRVKQFQFEGARSAKARNAHCRPG